MQRFTGEFGKSKEGFLKWSGSLDINEAETSGAKNYTPNDPINTGSCFTSNTGISRIVYGESHFFKL